MDIEERLSFLGKPVPDAFRLHEVALPPGCERPYDENEWLGALVVVERGTIELECTRGGRRRFERGAVLWLMGLPLRTIHSIGDEDAVLVAVSRRDR
jgi:hypothetical protein